MDAKSLTISSVAVALAAGMVPVALARRPSQTPADLHRGPLEGSERPSGGRDLAARGPSGRPPAAKPTSSSNTRLSSEDPLRVGETLRDVVIHAIRDGAPADRTILARELFGRVDVVLETILPIVVSAKEPEDVRLSALFMIYDVSPPTSADWATPATNALLQSDSPELRRQAIYLAFRSDRVAIDRASTDVLRALCDCGTSEACVLACRVLRRAGSLTDADYARVLSGALRSDRRSVSEALDAIYFDPPVTALGRDLYEGLALRIEDRSECVVRIAWREDRQTSFIMRTCEAALVVASSLNMSCREEVARRVSSAVGDEPEWGAALRLCLDPIQSAEDGELLLRSEQPGFRWIAFLVRLRRARSLEEERVLVERMAADRFEATAGTVEQWRSEHPAPK